MVEVVHPCEFRFIWNFTRTTLASGHVSRTVTTVCGQDDDTLMGKMHSVVRVIIRGVIIDKETARFLVIDHTGHRVRRLTSAAGRLTVPPPPGPSLGTWSVSMGFRLRPPIKRFTFWWEPPTGRFFLGHAIVE